jgi:hypothetical protein
VHVHVYEELGNPVDFLRTVLTEVGAGVDETWLGDLDVSKRENEKPWVKYFKQQRRPIQPVEVAALLDIYRPTIDFVRDLTGRRLSRWDDVDVQIERHTTP